VTICHGKARHVVWVWVLIPLTSWCCICHLLLLQVSVLDLADFVLVLHLPSAAGSVAAVAFRTL
jgi:hypothetical protein